MNVHVKLYKGYFWSAGKAYGWPIEDPGVGIKFSDIKRALPDGRVFVDSKYDKLSIAAKIAYKEVKEYQSFYIAGTIKLGIIRKSRFVSEKKKTWVDLKKEAKMKALEEQGQSKLFEPEEPDYDEAKAQREAFEEEKYGK